MKGGEEEEDEEEEEEEDNDNDYDDYYSYSGGGGGGGKSSNKDGLERAVHLLTTLITLSYTVKAFPVKWQLIRDKLLQLQAGLSPVLDLAVDATASRQLHHLISAADGLLASLRHCRRLARRCSDLSYSGKLLMQSDLDVAASRLSLHLAALDSLYSSGDFSHPSALVVSRPGPSPSRDDMHFYLRDLFTRLKIGTAAMRIHALASLNDVLSDDDSSRYASLVAAELPDLVSLLSNLLHRRSDPVVQEKSAEAVSVLAGFDACRAPLLGAGVVAHLVRALEDATDSGRESAARALLKLTHNSDNAWSVSAQGGVTVLLKICAAAAAADIGELASSACGILRNLVGVEEIKKFMVEEGAVSTLVGLLVSRRAAAKDEILQTRAIKLLQSMAAGDASVSRLVVREGAIEPLVATLDPNSHFTAKTQEIALRAIDSFCLSPAAPCPGVLLDLRFMDRILRLLRSGEAAAAAAAVYLQDAALKSALGLCRASAEAKRQMGEAGFMPELVRLLESKSFEVRVTAAEVLWSLLSVAKNTRKFIHHDDDDDDNNVARLLRLVEPEEEKPGHRKLLLSMLLSLASCSSGRKKIAASGYLNNIHRLADAQVPEAKRIMRKLSENRFTSLLNGIWHK